MKSTLDPAPHAPSENAEVRNVVGRRLLKAIPMIRKKGFRYVACAGLTLIRTQISRLRQTCSSLLLLYYNKLFRSAETFAFQNLRYRYFYHRYNKTYMNERCVEVPIVWRIVTEYRGKQILEVGNVLNHYFDSEHDVLDKYEKGDGIINQDVASFRPSKKYDLIVSISTLEHVGWDEDERDSSKIVLALENLKSALVRGGKMVITVPLGYNCEMDKLLGTGSVRFTNQFYMKRVSKSNTWREVDWETVKDARFNSPFPCANGIVIGVEVN